MDGVAAKLDKALAGDVRALKELRKALPKLGEEKDIDFDSLLSYCKEHAGKKNSVAMNILAYVYYTGIVVEKDYGEALRWSLAGAELGNSNSQGLLGTMYLEGNDVVKKDEVKALEYFRAAVLQGNAQAECSYGYLHFVGKGVEKDLGKAFELFRASAEKGETAAMVWLGDMYKEGIHVGVDFGEAKKWYGAAMALGDEDGKFCLEQLNSKN